MYPTRAIETIYTWGLLTLKNYYWHEFSDHDFLKYQILVEELKHTKEDNIHSNDNETNSRNSNELIILGNEIIFSPNGGETKKRFEVLTAIWN